MKYISIGSTLVLATILVNCSSAKMQSTEIECAPIAGAGEVLRADAPPITILGEFHGTQEMPRFAGDLVCQSLKAGYKTVLALEYGDEEDARIQTFLNAADRNSARQEFLTGKGWTNDFTDGRASRAMLGLIEQMGVYQKSGYDVEIRTFKPSEGEYEELVPDNPTQGYELRMSEKILEVSKHGEKTIVLVGNMHAKRGKASWPGQAEYDAAATHLLETDAITFDARYLSGTSWTCLMGEAGEGNKCGENEIRGFEVKNEYVKPEYSQGIAIDPNLKNYNGTFFVGKITASPPAGVIKK